MTRALAAAVVALPLLVACGGAPARHHVAIGREDLSPDVFAGASALLFAQRMCGMLVHCVEGVAADECVRRVGARVVEAAREAELGNPVPADAQLPWLQGPGSEVVLATFADFGEIAPDCQLEGVEGPPLQVEWRRGGCVRLVNDPQPCVREAETPP